MQFGQIEQGFFRDKALVLDQKNNLSDINLKDAQLALVHG